MRLYQSVPLLTLLFVAHLTACSPAAATTPQISISISADGVSQDFQVAAGGNVSAAIDAASIQLGPLDRTEPDLYSALADGDSVLVIRVSEEFEVEQKPLPFESRTLKNEAMIPGEQRLIQNGVNGLGEITYRLLYENGELISRTAVRETVITEPLEEIIMLGAESPFSSVAIPGRLAFLSAGNAWVLEQNTGARRPVVTSGDLDGRVFEVSLDGDWLLFSRLSADETLINELWVASLDEGSDTLIDLGVGNVVHYAGWVPGGSNTQIAFSTVEPSLNPPGWQANNDLQFINFTTAGEVTAARVGIPANEQGLYSWWGTSFAWSPDGEELIFARPDAVGFANIDEDEFSTFLRLTTYQTGSEWAWVPGISWSADGTLYTVEHMPQTGAEIQELSPLFDLIAITTDGEKETLAENVGMFAEPVPEPDGEQVAFLRALTPSQSDISAYELMVLAPGGNSISLFPPQGAAGLQPQRVAWSPSAESGPMIAFIYQGNLWLVNVLSGEAQQLTGDGLVTALAWQ